MNDAVSLLTSVVFALKSWIEVFGWATQGPSVSVAPSWAGDGHTVIPLSLLHGAGLVTQHVHQGPETLDKLPNKRLNQAVDSFGDVNKNDAWTLYFVPNLHRNINITLLEHYYIITLTWH